MSNPTPIDKGAHEALVAIAIAETLESSGPHDVDYMGGNTFTINGKNYSFIITVERDDD